MQSPKYSLENHTILPRDAHLEIFSVFRRQTSRVTSLPVVLVVVMRMERLPESYGQLF